MHTNESQMLTRATKALHSALASSDGNLAKDAIADLEGIALHGAPETSPQAVEALAEITSNRAVDKVLRKMARQALKWKEECSVESA